MAILHHKHLAGSYLVSIQIRKPMVVSGRGGVVVNMVSKGLSERDSNVLADVIGESSQKELSSAVIGTFRPALPDPDDPHATDKSGGEIVPARVSIVGNLQHRSDEFGDKIQLLDFTDFDGLSDFMNDKRRDIEKRNEATLKQVHEKFRGIVQEILVQRQLYSSVLGRQDETDPQVALYATPNVRLGRGKYANFLHSDSFFSNQSSTRAMINVWLVLNDAPPSNQLMFLDSPREWTRATHMLYGAYDHVQDTTIVYHDMCWGSFYCFVAGEAQSTPTVLLHGAVDIPGQPIMHRKSLELRYLV